MATLITITVPSQDKRTMQVTGYRFEGRVGDYCHWFIVHADSLRITHYDSGLFFGQITHLGAHLGDRVAAAKDAVKAISARLGVERVNTALRTAAPRPRAAVK